MSGLLFLIPIALFLGLIGLAGFLWTLRNGQYDDIDGASERILDDRYDDKPQD
ncbi:MAG: cbb3-type cytochrome oxidase assembly protein CcoS [OCS116 cluster bacterium]|uniref:Cbb3-type cytochrome oxidase assembly protein CcoS n=1 Tax=OCS116 cluster bacterium TaxID=2030921 RepID=A0A2A4Z671_9PROT|nr:cbb3-type cytochrome oxidase assembly protein CcoS [OCS116 cluster bacterium]